MIYALLIVWASTVLFYLLFLVWASWHQARIAGRHIPWASVLFIGPPVLFGYVLDLIWNTVLGSLFFAEVPWTESANPFRWTFTDRLIRWKEDTGWRGTEARWWATLVNWADPNHI